MTGKANTVHVKGMRQEKDREVTVTSCGKRRGLAAYDLVCSSTEKGRELWIALIKPPPFFFLQKAFCQ